MAKHDCLICGKEGYLSFYYCEEHLAQRKNGEIDKCEDCGNWYIIKNGCNCTVKSNAKENEKHPIIKTLTCIVCGESSNGNIQCFKCYKETQEHMKELNKNSRIAEFRDHYFNLKDGIFRIMSFENVKANCNRLFAIALINQKVNNDNSLTDRISKDIIDLIERKKSKDNTKTTMSQKAIENDERKQETIRTADGHYVKSDKEREIDDKLYEVRIPHSYGQQVIGIIDKPKFSDWFIPIVSTIKGIYIEYWGMDTPKYIENKKEKIELYNKYDIPFIEIQKNDLQLDAQGFIVRLINDINKKAQEKYKTNPNF